MSITVQKAATRHAYSRILLTSCDDHTFVLHTACVHIARALDRSFLVLWERHIQVGRLWLSSLLWNPASRYS